MKRLFDEKYNWTPEALKWEVDLAHAMRPVIDDAEKLDISLRELMMVADAVVQKLFLKAIVAKRMKP